jgi:hypothetical protein
VCMFCQGSLEAWTYLYTIWSSWCFKLHNSTFWGVAVHIFNFIAPYRDQYLPPKKCSL